MDLSALSPQARTAALDSMAEEALDVLVIGGGVAPPAACRTTGT